MPNKTRLLIPLTSLNLPKEKGGCVHRDYSQRYRFEKLCQAKTLKSEKKTIDPYTPIAMIGPITKQIMMVVSHLVYLKSNLGESFGLNTNDTIGLLTNI